MKAVTYKQYGTPEVLQLEEVVKPIPKDKEVLIKVKVVSLNGSDWEGLTGQPLYARIFGLFKPRRPILGSDIAGEVVAVGKNANKFKIGAAVFGDIMYTGSSGFAEYVCVREHLLLEKPKERSFQEVAAIPQAGVIALQGLRDKGQIQAGQQVLINGAGGSAGTFAIQLAKMYGAIVTGVDNTGKQDLMRSLGADYVIDYTKEDYTQHTQGYDLILDFVAHRSIFDIKNALKSTGRYVLVGGSMTRLLQTLFIGPVIGLTSTKKMGILGHEQRTEDMQTLLKFYKEGKIVAVIDDRNFNLETVPDALAYLGQGKSKGKVVIQISA